MSEKITTELEMKGGTLAVCLGLYKHLTIRRRYLLFLTIGLMVLTAILEVATIGAVYPFLAVLSNSSRVGASGQMYDTIDAFSAQIGVEPVIFLASLLSLLAVISAMARLVLTWLTFKFVFDVAHEFAMKVVDFGLNRKYIEQVQSNSSEIVASLDKIQHSIFYGLLPALQGLAAVIVAMLVLSALVFINPFISLGSVAFFAFFYLGAMVLSRRSLRVNSRIVSTSINARIQVIQESLGGIRDILLDGTQPYFIEQFRRVDSAFRRGQLFTYFWSAAPRYVVESAAVILIAVLAVIINGTEQGLIGALPVLGAFALGTQRMLPMVQQAYSSWSQLSGSEASLADLLGMLGSQQPQPSQPLRRGVAPLPFEAQIAFEDVSFRYPTSDEWALKNVSFSIPKGARVGIIGGSGAGKSTVIDLLMGLLEPTSGVIRVDDVELCAERIPAWQSGLAHVPQMIYLADSSIASNIAFGQEQDQIDPERLAKAVSGAEIGKMIEGLDDGFETKVGERGVRLSGGQRQRLGVARALYKNCKLLILDEATSALDDATEAKIIAALNRFSRDTTIIMIAHRLTTLRCCDAIFEFADGRMVKTGSYAEVITARSVEGAA